MKANRLVTVDGLERKKRDFGAMSPKINEKQAEKHHFTPK